MTGYRTNMHKLIAFLCTINKNTEKEIMNVLPFTKTMEKIKYREIKKDIKDLYNENFKFLQKEKDTENEKKFHALDS